VYSLTPQPGAQQHLDGDPDQLPGFGLGGAQQSGGRGVVERLGQRMVLAGQVAVEHRHPLWGLVPAPLVDPDEEHPQRAQPVREGSGGDPRLVLSRPAGQPRLVVLDVTPCDLTNVGDLGCGLDQEGGEGAKRLVGITHTARAQDAGNLVEIATHGLDQLWFLQAQLLPGGQQQWPAHRSAPEVG
jgi:hypothetical protein